MVAVVPVAVAVSVVQAAPAVLAVPVARVVPVAVAASAVAPAVAADLGDRVKPAAPSVVRQVAAAVAGSVVAPVVAPDAAGSRRRPSAKSSTTWRHQLLAASNCRWVTARSSGCPAARR